MPVSRNYSFAPVRGLHLCWLSSMETRHKNGPWGEGVTIPGLGELEFSDRPNPKPSALYLLKSDVTQGL